MRITSLLKKILEIKQIIVRGIAIENGALVIDVRPAWHKPRCSKCGKIRGGYDTLDPRLWRHLDFGGVRVVLRYAPRRVLCQNCGVMTEKLPWNDNPAARFTHDFEQQVAYLAQHADKTAVSRFCDIAWTTVGSIISRVVVRMKPDDPFADLEFIGIDELSYRKHHHYLTLVTNHLTGRIIWGAKGKGSDTLKAFFNALGKDRCANIKVVTIDMSPAYISAVTEMLPNADIVFDRFHVQKLVSQALDETRREQWQKLKRNGDEHDAQHLKHTRFALLKNPWNLSLDEKQKLADVQKNNTGLYRAYLLKESFAGILDGRQYNVVKNNLRDWIAWALRSRLPAFVKVAKTIRAHLDSIVGYVRWGLTNGLSEGLNNKARLLTRRAYGFHSADAAIAMIMLCCTGIELNPVRKVMHN